MQVKLQSLGERCIVEFFWPPEPDVWIQGDKEAERGGILTVEAAVLEEGS